MKSINKKGPNYETLLSVVLFLLIIFVLLRSKWNNADFLLYASLGLGICSLFSKAFAGLLTTVWHKMMAGIGFINSHIILTLIFFLVLLPISMLSKLFRKDQLQLKPKEGSYFKDRDHLYTSEDLKNMW